MSKAELEAMKAMVRAIKENQGTKRLSESTKRAQSRSRSNEAARKQFTHWGRIEGELERMGQHYRGGGKRRGTKRIRRGGKRRGTRRA